MKVSGLKLNFEEDGEIVVEKGKKQLPHRIDLIEAAYEEGDYNKVAGMLFNYTLRNCRHATDIKQSTREVAIAEKIIKWLEEKETINV
jgi:hypothetical protein